MPYYLEAGGGGNDYVTSQRELSIGKTTKMDLIPITITSTELPLGNNNLENG